MNSPVYKHMCSLLMIMYTHTHTQACIKYTCCYLFTVDMYGMMDTKLIPDGMALSSKLTDLEPSTKYLLYISAMTSAGTGIEYYIEDKTLELSSKYER